MAHSNPSLLTLLNIWSTLKAVSTSVVKAYCFGPRRSIEKPFGNVQMKMVAWQALFDRKNPLHMDTYIRKFRNAHKMSAPYLSMGETPMAQEKKPRLK